MKKIIKLFGYLAFFGNACFSIDKEDKEEDRSCFVQALDSFKKEMAKPFNQTKEMINKIRSGELVNEFKVLKEEIGKIISEGKLGEKLIEICKSEKKNISDVFNDPSRFKAMMTFTATGSATYSSIVLGANLALGGFLTPLAIPALIIGNTALGVSSIMNVAHDSEIDTISKGVGAGAAKGILSGFFAVALGEMRHFALANEHFHQCNPGSSVMHQNTFSFPVPVDHNQYNSGSSAIEHFSYDDYSRQHNTDFENLEKSLDAMEKVYKGHKFDDIYNSVENADSTIKDALKTTKNPYVSVLLEKMYNDLYQAFNSPPKEGILSYDQQVVHVIPPTASNNAHISFMPNLQEEISCKANIKNLDHLRDILKEYMKTYHSDTHPSIMQHAEKTDYLTKNALTWGVNHTEPIDLRVGHDPLINKVESIILSDVEDISKRNSRIIFMATDLAKVMPTYE